MSSKKRTARQELKIKALLIGIGQHESEAASMLLVVWKGRPFTDAAEAILSFVNACKAAAKAPERKLNGCCEELLKTLPKAKACPTCGKSFRASKTRDKDLREYIMGLHGATLDVASEVLDPHERSNGPDELRVGNWWLFEGFPLNCDVVEVSSLDITAGGEYAEESRYTTFSVGREHRRNCAWGSLVHEDLE